VADGGGARDAVCARRLGRRSTTLGTRGRGPCEKRGGSACSPDCGRRIRERETKQGIRNLEGGQRSEKSHDSRIDSEKGNQVGRPAGEGEEIVRLGARTGMKTGGGGDLRFRN